MSRTKHHTVPPAYRWGIASRVLAACCGGYGVAAVSSSVLALALPHLSALTRADAVLVATLLSFVIYTVAALWVFRARTALRAWIGLGVVCAFCAGALVLLQQLP